MRFQRNYARFCQSVSGKSGNFRTFFVTLPSDFPLTLFPFCYIIRIYIIRIAFL